MLQLLPIWYVTPPPHLALLFVKLQLIMIPLVQFHQQIPPPPQVTTLLYLKVESETVPFAPNHTTPPPSNSAVLLMKLELVIIPLSPFQQTPPPLLLLAVLLIKLQSSNAPSVPFHKMAPPFPFWKLKFQKENFMLK